MVGGTSLLPPRDIVWGGTMKPELLLKVDRKTKRMTEAERWRLFVKRYCELYLKKVMNPY